MYKRQLCRRAGKLVIGDDPCIDSMAKSKAKLILYANDFSQNSLKPVLLQAHKQNVRVLEVNRKRPKIFLSGRRSGQRRYFKDIDLCPGRDASRESAPRSGGIC